MGWHILYFPKNWWSAETQVLWSSTEWVKVEISFPDHVVKEKTIKEWIAVMTDRSTWSNETEDSVEKHSNESLDADDAVKIDAYITSKQNKLPTN